MYLSFSSIRRLILNVWQYIDLPFHGRVDLEVMSIKGYSILPSYLPIYRLYSATTLSSRRIALALNSLRRFICHQTKKLNQTIFTPQIFRTVASPSGAVYCHTQHISFLTGSYPSEGDAFNIFLALPTGWEMC